MTNLLTRFFCRLFGGHVWNGKTGKYYLVKCKFCYHKMNRADAVTYRQQEKELFGNANT